MERFILSKSSTDLRVWVIEDTTNGITCTFEVHKFNETQKVTFIGEVQETDVAKLASIMQEIDEWLHDNAYFIAMPLRDESDVNAYIGQQVRCIRLAKGWSKYRLSKNTGVTETHIVKIESAANAPGVQILYKLASALGTDFDIL